MDKPDCMPRLAPCYLWHHKRRIKMLRKYPELRKLMRETKKPNYDAWLGGILLAHLTLAASCDKFLEGFGVWGVVMAAALVGAGLAFNLQQLTHEISHNVLRPSYLTHSLMFLSDLSFGWCGPGWHSYYLLLHSQHHSYAGSREDPDVSFQMYWSVIPRLLSVCRVGRFVWVTFFGLFTMPAVLLCHFCGVNRLNFLMEFKLPVALLLSAKLGFWGLFYHFVGPSSVLYLWLSSGFALGAFAHPYIGFWLIQHLAFHGNGHQPTVSYGGSEVWQWANLGALRHVQHHDFPTIPFTLCHRIKQIAPEFYENLHEVKSIFDVTWEWMCHTDGSAWMDFAANQRWSMSQMELPVLNRKKRKLIRSVLQPISKLAEERLTRGLEIKKDASPSTISTSDSTGSGEISEEEWALDEDESRDHDDGENVKRDPDRPHAGDGLDSKNLR
mmetsp:Transcript_23033/g.40763  ORF Transcript_23033/g.40763 Transcript_23033/m.40763 type:complete len:441 (+) Transcript_23033:200-1522(+)